MSANEKGRREFVKKAFLAGLTAGAIGNASAQPAEPEKAPVDLKKLHEYGERSRFEAAVRSGMAAELSSAGWRKPVGEEYPAPPLLRRFIDQGVPLTTASDAHSLPDVADRVDDLRDLLVTAGVSRLQGFRSRQPYEVAVATPEGN